MQIPVERKYKIRRQVFAGMETSFDWITDTEIEGLLLQETGKPISLLAAAQLFYDSAITSALTLDHSVLDLGIVGFAVANGYKIEILKDLVGAKGSEVFH
jgi:hypothetical protein